jgi:SAM-dependent methyltransferase
MSKGLHRKISQSLKRRGFLGTLKRCVEEPFHLISECRPARIRYRRAQKEFDRRYGVDTVGVIPLSALDIEDDNWQYGVGYEPTDPEHFTASINDLPIRFEEFTFIDFGSGKGRALLLASEFPFRRILGVEISSRLHVIAEQNIRDYRNDSMKCTAVQSICSDATKFRIPDEPTVFYFFNPFQELIMAKVLSNIEESLRTNPRTIYTVYKAPLLGSLFDRAGFLRKIKVGRGYATYTNL